MGVGASFHSGGEECHQIEQRQTLEKNLDRCTSQNARSTTDTQKSLM